MKARVVVIPVTSITIVPVRPAAPLKVVCAWHTPRPELDALNRQYPGQISHSLCPACAERLLQEVA